MHFLDRPESTPTGTADGTSGTHLLEGVRAALDELGLCGRRIVVGVSGGADSVALLRLLHETAGSSRLEIHAAHLNHGLRGDAADEDAEWTRQLCRGLDVPILIETVDVRQRVLQEQPNLEAAARAARYEFLKTIARRVESAHVAVAHTADDQAETVLHHIFRGTGLSGLRGMRPSRSLSDGISLVRPLLATSRRQIETWLAEIGQDFRTDATNADVRRTRSRIRHVVLPSLERELGPSVRPSLLRLAEQADEWQTAIESTAARLLTAALMDDSCDTCRLHCGESLNCGDPVNRGDLAVEPRHIVREVLVSLWKRKGWPRQKMGFREWDRLYEVYSRGGSVTLPGRIQATRRGTLLVLQRLRTGSSGGAES